MVLNLLDQTLLGEVFHHGRARLVAVKPLVGAGLLGHATFFVDHHEARQFMAERDFKVIRVVGRSYFYRPGPKFRVNEIVGDDRDYAPEERQGNLPTDQFLITGIQRMNGHGGIPQHRFRPSGGHSQVF